MQHILLIISQRSIAQPCQRIQETCGRTGVAAESTPPGSQGHQGSVRNITKELINAGLQVSSCVLESSQHSRVRPFHAMFSLPGTQGETSRFHIAVVCCGDHRGIMHEFISFIIRQLRPDRAQLLSGILPASLDASLTRRALSTCKPVTMQL